MEPGTKLGPYEITEQLGAGGMGEVWLAEDTRLGRKVAIKVLPAEFASDPERLARFEQEARAAAALNHPHIASVFDVGVEDGTHFMVQEYLEGDTLRVPLGKGALPLTKALGLATEIAEALAAAHAAGIIHRDLKPENIFVTKEGHAKVLDFGLAKLTEVAVSGSPGGATQSPTMMGTVAGQVMGTAGYMAPEQVEGSDKIDHRADLFAFGCVLYEMVSGRRPFAGTNVHETLGRIVDKDPEPLAAIDARLPAEVQRIAKKCLAKDPGRRYQTATDLAVDLQTLRADVQAGQAVSVGELNQLGESRAADGSVADVASGLSKRTIPLRWAAALVVLSAFAAMAGTRGLMTSLPASNQPVVMFDIALSVPFSYTGRHILDISSDGTEIVIAAGAQLHRRRTDDADALIAIQGTEGGSRSPFISPDGTEVGFWTPGQAGGELRKVSINGGLPTVLCAALNPWGATWLDDGTILFGQGSEGILRVSAEGGDPEVVIAVAEGEWAHGPRLLPDGDSVLFTLRTGTGSWDNSQVVVGSLTHDDRRVLFDGGTDARYLPTGHIVYIRDGVLMARVVDLGRLEVGAETRLMDGVAQALSNLTGAGHFNLSANGTLAYVQGAAMRSRGPLPVVWVADGTVSETVSGDLNSASHPRLSPDESHVAVMVTDDDGVNYVEVQDLSRGIWTRLTTEGNGQFPVWSHDGRSVYFTSNRGGEPAIYRRPIDFSRSAEEVWRPGVEAILVVDSASRDGRYLFTTAFRDATLPHTWVVRLDQPPTAQPLFDDGFRGHAQIHPSGKWIAFVSEAIGGQPDVLVAEFPVGRTWQISSGPGEEPMWSRDGTQLFYREAERMMAVHVETDPEFRPQAPRELIAQFVAPTPVAWIGSGGYDVAGDGRFLTTIGTPTRPEDDDTPSVRVVLNWFDELKRLVPTDP